ncbi:hypothetical protein CWI38_0442p0010 [Hamiltosporidium tvaerminnensis]|uniref:Uncharacterized protein n=1 Tax=Hamiltosporidium tvaerminnensis TaxID=1176355 RepID=A0A4Q9LZN9_9MICR|nr:hypothetical protein CWI38_0442p0010 [Hamiltosporidium tvaerminnensis]
MIGTSIKEFLDNLICYQRGISFLILVSFGVDLKAKDNLVIHFYNELFYKSPETYLIDKKVVFSKFVKKKFKCYAHIHCLDCKKFTIKNRTDCPFNFKYEDLAEPNTIIFVNSNILTYEDFIHCYSILKNTSGLKNDLNVNDFLLVIRILDIFKFKKDKCFKQIIRVLLMSLFFKNEGIHKKYNINMKTVLSPSLFKHIFYEFGRIYFFRKDFFKYSLLYGCQSDAKIMKELYQNFDTNYIGIQKFISVNSSFIAKINNLMKFDTALEKKFEIVFGQFKIQAMHIYFDRVLNNLSTHLQYLFFSHIEELCISDWHNTLDFFEQIDTNYVFQYVKCLIFIRCEFSSFPRNIFKNMISLKHIYFILSRILSIDYFNEKYKRMQIFHSFIYDELISKENINNFREITNNQPIRIKNISKKDLNSSNKDMITVFAFKDEKYRVYTLNKLGFEFENFMFDVFISNIQTIKKINLTIREICMKGLIFKNSFINQNINSIKIFSSRLEDDILHNILTIPSLKKLEILYCTIVFNKEIKFKKNMLLKYLFLEYCNFENPNRFVNLINSMPKLQQMNLRYNTNLNVFEQNYKDKISEFEFLTKLVFCKINDFEGEIPEFPDFKFISNLDIGFRYKEGSIFKLFFNKSLNTIQYLSIHSFKIGKKDEHAISKSKNMKHLYFYDCEFINITFSDLFDTTETYMIERLILEKISLCKPDVLFLNSLIHLKILQLEIEKFIIDPSQLLYFYDPGKSEIMLTLCAKKEHWCEMCMFVEIYGGNNLIYCI